MIDEAGRGRLAALLSRSDVARLFAALDSGGAELRIVGGAVRNALIGLPPGDIDCATTALPEETIRRARAAGMKVIPTGIEHGTVTVLVDRTPFEVTTLREDVETDGRRAIVRFGHDFSHDAARRDFTINALSLDAAGRLHDYTDGVADLARRHVRFIGDPDQRIREDYLRILRFFRFHAEYGEGPPDGPALNAAIRHRAGLDLLSRERIRHEMARLLMAPGAVAVIGDLSAASLLDRILAGLGELGRLSRVIDGVRPAQAWVDRLAALAVMSPSDVPRLRERLRLSNAETAILESYAKALVAAKNAALPQDRPALRRLVYRIGLEAVALAITATSGEPRPALTPDGQAAIDRLASGEEALPMMPFNGEALRALGVTPGPGMGALIRQAETLWLDADMPSDAETCRLILNQAMSASGSVGRA